MKVYLLIICVALCFASCKNQPNTTNNSKNSTSTTADSTSANATTASSTSQSKECYVRVAGNDSVLIQLFINNESITGTMLTSYSGKDRNTGTLQANFRGDTLLADYTFMSEGTQSVRQVAFLKKGDSLTEGFAAMEEKNGKMVFRNLDSLKFNDKWSLKKTDCK